MNDFERIIRTLERHISPIHARSLLSHALSEHRVSTEEFRIKHLVRINGALSRGLRLFLNEDSTEHALQELAALGSNVPPKAEPCSIDIAVEADISRARNAARHLCEQLGAKGYSIQKITTIVSELARNIVSYTPGGKIDLLWNHVPNERMVIRAVDRGPGISNLDLIMSGEYRSKTGLGRGVLGSKRLSDHFEIRTGSDGTCIVCEVRL